MISYGLKVKVVCSRCGSDQVVKPVNDNFDWEYKCLECGHEKKREMRMNVPKYSSSTESFEHKQVF